MVNYPREMWAGSPMSSAVQLRRVVVNNLEEYRKFVTAYNGKMNVYTSVYDYEKFTENRGIEHTVVMDRLFLDFDAHGDEPLWKAYEDFKTVQQWLSKQNYKHTMAFSGRGFYIFVMGKRTFDIRKVKAGFDIIHDVIGKSPRLDKLVINPARLRRVQNTYHMGAKRFSINLELNDLSKSIEEIVNMAKRPRKLSPQYYGDKLMVWPKIEKMRESKIEIESVESPGVLPILPCLKTAVMVQNPLHRSRHLLVQWYNEMLSEMTVIEKELSCHPREISGDALEDIANIICKEIESIAAGDEVWMDYNENTTRKAVGYVVKKRYMAPSCHTLINEGYCVGKCWRYPSESEE